VVAHRLVAVHHLEVVLHLVAHRLVIVHLVPFVAFG
jgi:hypothetical protein